MTADLASLIILDPLQLQAILSKTPITLKVDRMDACDDISVYVTPNEAQRPVEDNASSKQHLSGVYYNFVI